MGISGLRYNRFFGLSFRPIGERWRAPNGLAASATVESLYGQQATATAGTASGRRGEFLRYIFAAPEVGRGGSLVGYCGRL
jgi:hypothetical protein